MQNSTQQTVTIEEMRESVDFPRGNPMRLADGRDWILAPLSLGHVEKYMDVLGSGNISPQDFKLVPDIAFASLKRNYPKITREYIADELVDLGHIEKLFQTVMLASGFLAKHGDRSDDVASDEGKA